MVDKLAEEAARGVDIARRYPSQYQRLLSDENLYAAYLAKLKTFEAGQKKSKLPPPSADLSFLGEIVPQPTILRPSWQQWRFIWQLNPRFLSKKITESTSVAAETAHLKSGREALKLFMMPLQLDHDMIEVALSIRYVPPCNNIFLRVTISSHKGRVSDMVAILKWGTYEMIKNLSLQQPTVDFAPITANESLMPSSPGEVTQKLMLSIELRENPLD